MTDLFEIIETLPLDIQNVLSQFEHEGYDYETCAKYLSILKTRDYSFEYGLDGTPFNLTETKRPECPYANVDRDYINHE